MAAGWNATCQWEGQHKNWEVLGYSTVLGQQFHDILWKKKYLKFLMEIETLLLSSGKSVCKSVSCLLLMVGYIKPKSRQWNVVIEVEASGAWQLGFKSLLSHLSATGPMNNWKNYLSSLSPGFLTPEMGW